VTAVPDVHQPPFRRAVLAVNGGASDARIVRLACQAAKLSKAQLVAVHVVEIDWSLPLEVLDAVEGIAESEHQDVETVLLQARDVGAALVDEASERAADLLILGLPYRKRFGGDFAIGRTIPYVFSNAPCAVWVVREPISETARG
jgi:nucleotide-binding universal stress UspA family protein